MKYEATICIKPGQAKFIEEALEDGMLMEEDDIITNSVRFDNGFVMDIKCCGTDGGCPAWTEAVLFDKEGNMVTFTDIEDDYFGEWEMEDNDRNLYIAHVEIEKTEGAKSMITLGDLKTGMRVRTKSKGDYYVILDWTHQKAGKAQCTGLLIRTSENHETPWLFHGLLGYNPDLTFPTNTDWNIEHVYIYTGITLDEMEEDTNSHYWTEITEPVKYDQQMLARYFAKFD